MIREDDLLGRPLALVVALALVSLLPFVFMSVTSFVKISTVLQIVRGAIGAQNVPSSTVIMALAGALTRSEEHTSELQSHVNLVCRLLLEKKKKKIIFLINKKKKKKKQKTKKK